MPREDGHQYCASSNDNPLDLVCEHCVSREMTSIELYPAGTVFGSLRGPPEAGDIPEGYTVEHDKRGNAYLVRCAHD